MFCMCTNCILNKNISWNQQVPRHEDGSEDPSADPEPGNFTKVRAFSDVIIVYNLVHTIM